MLIFYFYNTHAEEELTDEQEMEKKDEVEKDGGGVGGREG